MKKLILLVTVFALLGACKTLEKNIAAAERAVALARQVGAPEAAAEDFTKAESLLKAAKENAVTNKKAANQEALDSRENAQTAYFKTVNEVPVREAAKTAETRGKAVDSKADVLAADMFSEAEKKSAEAAAEAEKVAELKKQLEAIKAQEAANAKK